MIRQAKGGARTFKVAADGLGQAAGPYKQDHPAYLSCWWDWVSGSTPFFWNWPYCYREEVRDGQRHFLMGEFGKFVWPQQPGKTKRDAELVRSKMVPVRLKNYIEPGLVDSLIHYFYLPKGLKDIRMMYKTHTIRSLIPCYCQCNLDQLSSARWSPTTFGGGHQSCALN